MKRKILINDDDAELSMIVRDMLEDYGYEAVIALSAEQAYRLLEHEAECMKGN